MIGPSSLAQRRPGRPRSQTPPLKVVFGVRKAEEPLFYQAMLNNPHFGIQVRRMVEKSLELGVFTDTGQVLVGTEKEAALVAQNEQLLTQLNVERTKRAPLVGASLVPGARADPAPIEPSTAPAETSSAFSVKFADSLRAVG